MLIKQFAFTLILIGFSLFGFSQAEYRYGSPNFETELLENPLYQRKKPLEFPTEKELQIAGRAVKTSKNGNYLIYDNLTYEQVLFKIKQKSNKCDVIYKIYQFDVNTFTLKIGECPPKED